MNVAKYFQQNAIKEILMVSIIILGSILFVYVFEKPLSYEKATMFGGMYFRVAQNISAHQPIIDESPYVYRLGTPFLVALFFPDDLFLGFKAINLIASVICVYLLLFWLRLYLKNSFVRMILIVLFTTHWLGVLRMTLNNPVHVDAVSLIFNLLGFIFIFYLRDRKNDLLLIAAFSFTVFIGVFFRESAIFIPFVYVILQAHDLLRAMPRAKLTRQALLPAVPFVSGLLGVLLTRFLVTPTNPYYLLGTMVFWFYEKPFPVYVQSYFTTFGPMLAILVSSWGIIRNFLLREKFNLYYLALICFLAWGIGSDTDRFLYWAMPVVYVMFGLAIEYLRPMFCRNWIFPVIILLLQCLAQRSFLPTPDFAPEKIIYRVPILTVICNDGCSLDIPSYNGITGSGLDAAMCTPSPCIQNGILFPLQWFLLMEHLLTAGILVYFLLRIKTRFLSPQSLGTEFQTLQP